ncbi:conserved hypothetical protein [Gloeothece citriformis PCC 7424]|uniref:Cyclic nucleotide-binding protein n=1 Tax=Gloeothece citriformis (strain PCC 7424) TaxID=65393 RepID=B7K757_GLOC7|nr:tetratricopeptide repeat protein [Gloeothece citriformis]ACK69625.1 conserved hypothetical protein [Gloeothece citriformis PCC 7424]
MYNNVVSAIERQDYQTAQNLLNQIEKEDSENPWFLYYTARLEEATGNLEKAKQNYSELLRQTPNPKIISQARQGIDRIKEQEEYQYQIAKAQRQEILAQIKANSDNNDFALLILEPIENELKKTAAQKFARIMDIDPYTARLQLPSRAWRLYRTGLMGTLSYYQELLTAAEIPCFCVSLPEIKQISVYQIKYFQSLSPRVVGVYETQKGEQHTITFEWNDVSQRVEGLIPIFEECVEMDAKRKLYRKTKTLDYIHICDLHLKKTNSIIRLWDQNYDFQKGVSFSDQPPSTEGKTTHNNWTQLTQYLKQQLPDVSVWSDFTPFAETALNFQEMLKLIEPHLSLFRREETAWDAAFELYSRLALIKK